VNKKGGQTGLLVVVVVGRHCDILRRVRLVVTRLLRDWTGGQADREDLGTKECWP
jgi:hypothetical protein